MKKLLAAMVCLVFVMLLSFSAFATESDQPVLPTDAEQAIRMCYVDTYGITSGFTADDLGIRYYGTYDGTYVVLVQDFLDRPSMDVDDIICGYCFTYNAGVPLLVYRDGQLIPLKDAWEAGWLTEESIGRLHSYYANGVYVPDTGDTTLIPVVVAMLLSGTGLAVLAIRRKRAYA